MFYGYISIAIFFHTFTGLSHMTSEEVMIEPLELIEPPSISVVEVKFRQPVWSCITIRNSLNEKTIAEFGIMVRHPFLIVLLRDKFMLIWPKLVVPSPSPNHKLTIRYSWDESLWHKSSYSCNDKLRILLNGP